MESDDGRRVDPAELIRRIDKSLRQYAHRLANNPGDLDADDLYQEGAIAAVGAMDRFDPARGAKVETFCLHRGRGAMLDAARRYDETTRRDKHTSRCVVIARKVAVSVLAGRQDNRGRWEAEAGRTRVGGWEPAECDPAPPTTPADFERHVRRVCRVKPDRARVLSLYFVEGLSMSAIGEREGYSESNVWQHLRKALAELRDAADANGWTAGDVAERILAEVS